MQTNNHDRQGDTMERFATLLLFCDSRSAWSEDLPANPDDSLLALPQKRQWLYDYAAERSIKIAGQVTIEIEPHVDIEKLVNRTVDSLCDFGTETVLSVDRFGLEESGLFKPLMERLQFWRRTLVEVQLR
ncbi:MAG: hypothetical protein K2W95_01510 [Candidatus Obscuribacterales bacterium]|nr:hypothetical protein [Candidatus Obscuribacterales bacterium]